MKDSLKTSSYDYTLPQNLIASYPASPADTAKLMVYDRKNDTITHTIFRNLYDFLPKKTSVLLNDTKVIKARIFGKKTSGGKIEVLLNSPLSDFDFKVYMRGKVRIGTIVNFDKHLSLEVKKLYENGMREVSFFKNDVPLRVEEVYDILEHIGHIPLPPYIKRDDEKSDEKNYQTLFASKKGAVAAPTASLHFTPKMFEELKRDYKTAFITLHVGAGTFKPIEVEDINHHQMHEEYFSISNEAKDILLSDDKVLAIGTTVTRVVEYFARNKKESGWCELFLHPQNPPLRVDFLLTNFHLPRSTLLMLVASFVGLQKSLTLYEEAIEKEYRFFSYGDAMLIL